MSVAESQKAPTFALTTAWRRALLWLAAMLLLLLLTQAQILGDMARIWWVTKTFNHCLIIPLISAWLIWRRRDVLARLQPEPSLLALALLGGAMLLLLFADLAGIGAASHFALVLAIQALIWLVLGTAVCRQLLFPLLYLWFAVPFGEFMVPALQDVTADMAVALLRLFDIPVFRDGHFIALPNGDFLVEEACSGISYLIASLALGTLYAYLQYRSYWRRGAFIALAIIVPIIANGVRAFGIILIAHLTNNEYAVGIDHLIYGWLFFGFVMLLLFSFGRWFSDEGPQSPNLPELTDIASFNIKPLLLALALVLIPGLLNQAPVLPAPVTFSAPAALPNWQSVNPLSSGSHMRGAEQQLALSDGVMLVHLGYFPFDGRQHELVNSQHALYNRDVFHRLQSDRRSIAGIDATGFRLANSLNEQINVHQLYLFANRIEGSAWRAKWQQMTARMTQQPVPALLVFVHWPASLPAAERDARLQPLLQAMQKQLPGKLAVAAAERAELAP